jgi:arsenite-transporting ATPase
MTHSVKNSGSGANKNVLMFVGKGGVGKTTCAAATALHHSLCGRKTMAISTDPTPSLGHIFETGRCSQRTSVRKDLSMYEIGVQEAKEMWDRRFGREVYEVFSSFVAIDYQQFLDFVTEVLPGLKDEFLVDYIRELAVSGDFANIIWDTAPLGQTLGLLGMPSLLKSHLKAAPRINTHLKLVGASKRDVMNILAGWEQVSAIDIDFLRTQVSFVLVTIPEALAVEQLEDILAELRRYDITVDRLIINNVIKDTGSEFLAALARQQQLYLDRLHDTYNDLGIIEMERFPHEIKGLDKLRLVEAKLYGMNSD